MTLTSGERLGPYEIQSPIGAGGMGEVYRARDTRLDRVVAIKLLPASFADRPERRQRFHIEARAISSLQHPHICTLFDIGEEDGQVFLVFEYLEGETLEDRLTPGALPANDVLRYASQIASALDHAHRARIVHRDLKPSNVMLTESGAKLLDFGLARAPALASTAASTVSFPQDKLTAEGTIVGTFRYMSPEQLEGREADERTDIFAFGALLYEMATGRFAFEGTNQASLIASILTRQPPSVSSARAARRADGLPDALDHVVERCLAKNPDDRWQTARDLRAELGWIVEGKSRSTRSTPIMAAAEGPGQGRKLPLIGAAALLVSMGAVAAGVLYRPSRPLDEPSVQLTFSPPADVDIVDVADAGPVTIAPDGRRMVFVARGSDGRRLLWVRELDSADARALPGTDGASYPFWSPDSRLIGFFARGILQTISATGGPPQTIGPATHARGGTWNRDGVIVFSGNAGEQLYRTSAEGGLAVPLLGDRPNRESLWPSFLPDGRNLVYFARPERPGIYLASLDSKDTRLLAAAFVGVAPVPRHLLLLQTGGAGGASLTTTLIAQPFDAGRLQLTGNAFPVADQILYRTLWARGGFSASNNGRLIVQSDTWSTELAWFDRRGQKIETVGRAVTHPRRPVLSPDNAMVATEGLDSGQSTDIKLFDLAGRSESRLTSDPALDAIPRWSPDGTQIVFASARDNLPPNLFRKAATGIGREERLLKSNLIQNPTDWSRDGSIVFAMLDPKTQWDLWRLPMNPGVTNEERTPVPLLRTPFNEYNGQVSPDGRWITYDSDESGEWEIYVEELAALGRGVRKRISTNGGVQPVWRSDGRTLFYLAADTTLMEVAMKLGSSLESAPPQPLFRTRIPEVDLRIRTYSVSRDGKRFLFSRRRDEANSAPITVILNWPAALRER